MGINPAPPGPRTDRTKASAPPEVQCKEGYLVMSLANLFAFERFFDRSVAVFLVGLGVALAGATAAVGI